MEEEDGKNIDALIVSKLTSVAVVAEILLRSPWKLFIIII